MSNNINSILADFMKGDQTYVNMETALKNINVSNINKRISEKSNTIWELIEHIRITQEDILKYTLDKNWESPSWPEGHWPEKNSEGNENLMNNSIKQILNDFKEVQNLAGDKTFDLTAAIPHGEWRTYLREVLLVIEHNAYHLGQLILLRKFFNDWK